MSSSFDDLAKQARALPAAEKAALLRLLIDELDSSSLQELAAEQRWDELLASSQETLARLADEALADHAAGRTTPL